MKSFLIHLKVTLYLIWMIEQAICLRAVDLSFGYDKNSIGFPGSEPFGWIKQWAGPDPEGVWYSSNDFKTSEHCGTHMDAPYHFNKDGHTIDQIPINRLFTTGVLINATRETNDNSSYVLPQTKLIEWENQHGRIPNNSLIIINFGWSKFYDNRRLYLGPSEKDLRFPGISLEAANWMIDTNKVVGVAVDTASVDPGIKTDAHLVLTRKGIYIIENLNLSEPLPHIFNVIALPMKLINGTGAPVRVVASF